jgi:hypothetical protein
MAVSGKLPGTNYTLYNVSYTRDRLENTHPFDVVATGPGMTVTNNFNDWFKFPGSPLALTD